MTTAIPDQIYASLTRALSAYSRIVLITDASLLSLHGQSLIERLRSDQFSVSVIIVSEGESAKSLETVTSCWHKMSQWRCDRHSCLIGLGGGAITDLTGFVGGCYMRGLDLFYLPTTLLGMVDASLGGKTAINFANTKNLIGLFHQPKAVFTIPGYLQTLPHRAFCSGLAEVIKYGIIWDANLFAYLEREMPSLLTKERQPLEWIIARSQQIKTEIVEKDFHDRSIRAILNWGHTFAHALEVSTRDYLHGEAVAIGMCCAAKASHLLGLAGKEFPSKIERICRLAGLPTQLSLNEVNLTEEEFAALMMKDKKKAHGKLNLILGSEIGKVFQQAVTFDDLIGLLKGFNTNY